MPFSVAKKVYLTLFLLTLVLAGRSLPVPGYDLMAWRAYYSPSADAGLPITLFSAGIEAYLSAAVFLLLLSGFIPGLRRLREGDAAQTRRFDTAVLALTVLFGFLRAAQLAYVFSNAGSDFSFSLSAKPLLIIPTVTTGALVVAWLSILITRHGIGNGVALILLVEMGNELGPVLFSAFRLVFNRDPLSTRYLLVMVLILGLAAACVLVLHAHRRIALVREEGPHGSTREPAPAAIRVPLNMVGVMPVAVAASLSGIPGTLHGFGWEVPLAWFPGSLYLPRLGLEFLIIVLFTYIITAWGYGTKDVPGVLARFGYRPAETESVGGVERLMDGALGGMAVWLSAFLCLLSLAPLLLTNLLEVDYGLTRFAGIPVLVATAILLDTRRQLVTAIAMSPSNWVSVTSYDTELEAELAGALLADGRIESVVHANRWMSALGTLTLWGPCRATYPALMPHRRLGAGAVRVFVREEDLERARALIPHSPR